MLHVIDALDHFLEAARKVSKQRALKPLQRKLEKAMRKAFELQGKSFLKGFGKLESKFPPAVQESDPLAPWMRAVGRYVLREAIDAGDLDDLFDDAYDDSQDAFLDPIQEAAGAALVSGSKAMLAALGYDLSFDLTNPRAVAYLKAHGAELVKKIDETTRADIKHIVEYGIENGWSYSKTAQAIQRQFRGYYDAGSWWNFDAPRPQGHIDSRAHLIAVTEAGEAYEAGNYAVIQDLTDGGLEMEKAWSTMKDDRVSQGCRDNEAEGWIPADQEHQSGHMHPLRFPGCRCDELYRAKE